MLAFVWLVRAQPRASWPFLSIVTKCESGNNNNKKVCALEISYTTAYFSFKMTVFLLLSVLRLLLLLLSLANVQDMVGEMSHRHTHIQQHSNQSLWNFIYFNIMPLISEIICGKFLAHQLQFVIRVDANTNTARRHTQRYAWTIFEDRSNRIQLIHNIAVCSFRLFTSNNSKKHNLWLTAPFCLQIKLWKHRWISRIPRDKIDTACVID